MQNNCNRWNYISIAHTHTHTNIHTNIHTYTHANRKSDQRKFAFNSILANSWAAHSKLCASRAVRFAVRMIAALHPLRVRLHVPARLCASLSRLQPSVWSFHGPHMCANTARIMCARSVRASHNGDDDDSRYCELSRHHLLVCRMGAGFLRDETHNIHTHCASAGGDRLADAFACCGKKIVRGASTFCRVMRFQSILNFAGAATLRFMQVHHEEHTEASLHRSRWEHAHDRDHAAKRRV